MGWRCPQVLGSDIPERLWEYGAGIRSLTWKYLEKWSIRQQSETWVAIIIPLVTEGPALWIVREEKIVWYSFYSNVCRQEQTIESTTRGVHGLKPQEIVETRHTVAGETNWKLVLLTPNLIFEDSKIKHQCPKSEKKRRKNFADAVWDNQRDLTKG